ncbi:hypothetical protein [Asticcacaulis sp.]|uniref:hypothetical protein n=1 Tax=Asticcacaulis sp. TaxID=1872648 RepID=UPI002BDF24B5|nr:hypothetical protein [Asticcacaulis sp.]HTM79666.1 hypothetical protein [Asticcacaulis sp.]
MSDMRLERLKAIIEAYGAHAARWPEAEREAALACLDAHPEAQAWLAEARGLDDMMEAVKVVDQARAEDDQPLFEVAVERFAADFAPARNVISFPVRPRPAPVSRSIFWSAGIAAAACLAGAVLGVNLSLMGLSDLRVTSVLEQVAMIDGGN